MTVLAPRIINTPAVRPVIPRPHVDHGPGIISRAIVVVAIGIAARITVVVVSISDRETEADSH